MYLTISYHLLDDSAPVPGLPSTPGSGSSSVNAPAIHGDWVLFHPVYAGGEVDAVKVRILWLFVSGLTC
jgi:hypothetical protein